MLLHHLRLALILLCVVIGAVLHTRLGFGYGAILCYATAVLLTATHFLFGTVWHAFRELQRGNPEVAERLLSRSTPATLLRSPRAYYHFTQGMIALQRKELATAEPHLRTAYDLGLRSSDDRALTALNLAHLYLLRKDKQQSRAWLDRAQSHPIRDLMLRENLEKMERVFKV